MSRLANTYESIALVLLIVATSLAITPTVNSLTTAYVSTQNDYDIDVDGNPSDWPSIPPQHPRVVVDGMLSDWYNVSSLDVNNYTVTHGEYIWRDRVGDERNDFEIRIDGDKSDWIQWSSYLAAIDTSDPDPTVLDITGANLTKLYTAWDSSYLYIAIEANNSDSWTEAYGIGLDVNGLTSGYNVSYGTSDAWGRSITFSGYAIDYEIYFFWNGGSGTITSNNLCEWTGSGWNYYDITAIGGEYAYSGDSATGLQFLEIKIPWSSLGGAKPSSIAVIAWVAGRSAGDSAVDSTPHDPAVIDNPANEWSDVDNFTQLAIIQLDANNEARDRRVDIVEFHVTSNNTHLLLMIKLRNLTVLGVDGAPAILIAMDTDTIYTNGETWLALNSDTQTSGNGPWDYQLVIDLARPRLSDLTIYRGGDGTDSIIVYDSSWTRAESSNTVFIVNMRAGVIEAAVSWTDIGVSTPYNVSNIRFTVATVRSNGAGDSWDIAGKSDVLDCITSYGVNTWDEVVDGVIDGDDNTTTDSGDGRLAKGFIDVGFNTIPEPASLQTLFLYNSTYVVILDPFDDHRDDYLKIGPGPAVEDWDVDVIEFRMYISRSDNRVYMLAFMHGNVRAIDQVSPAIAVVIDYTPLDPSDGVSEWVYAPSGWGYTDTYLRLNETTNSTWQYIVWLVMDDTSGVVAVHTPDNPSGVVNPVGTEIACDVHVLEASLPIDYIGRLVNLSRPFRVNVLVYGYQYAVDQLMDINSSNVYDIAGVPGTWGVEITNSDQAIDTVFIRKLETRIPYLDTYMHRLVFYPGDIMKINASLQYYNISTGTWEPLAGGEVSVYLIGSSIYLGSNTTDENGTLYLESMLLYAIQEGSYRLYAVYNETTLYLGTETYGPTIQIQRLTKPLPEPLYTTPLLLAAIATLILLKTRRKNGPAGI